MKCQYSASLKSPSCLVSQCNALINSPTSRTFQHRPDTFSARPPLPVRRAVGESGRWHQSRSEMSAHVHSVIIPLVDIADLLGVSKQRAHQIADGRSFPTPVGRMDEAGSGIGERLSDGPSGGGRRSPGGSGEVGAAGLRSPLSRQTIPLPSGLAYAPPARLRSARRGTARVVETR